MMKWDASLNHFSDFVFENVGNRRYIHPIIKGERVVSENGNNELD